MSVTREKIYSVANKVTNSKPYKALEATAVTAGATLASIGTMSISAFALDPITVPTELIMENASPFITPALTVMCVFGGIKLGVRLIKGSMH